MKITESFLQIACTGPACALLAAMTGTLTGCSGRVKNTTPTAVVENSTATDGDLAERKPRPHAAAKSTATVGCPTDESKFPKYDRRRLLRDTQTNTMPQHVRDNAAATVMIIGRDAIKECNATECRIHPTQTYEHKAATSVKCNGARVCEHPFNPEKVVNEGDTWAARRCSGVFVSKDIVATASHCLNLIPAAATSSGEDPGSTADLSPLAVPEAKKPKTKAQKETFRFASYDEIVFIAGVTDWSKPIPRSHMAQAMSTIYLENWKIRKTRSAVHLEDVGDVALVWAAPYVHKAEGTRHAVSVPLEVPHVSWNPEGAVPRDQSSVYVLGHPAGLPLTLSGCAKAEVASHRSAFKVTAEVLSGSSGSPVFDAEEGHLVGLIQDDGSPWTNDTDCCSHAGFDETDARASSFAAAASFVSRHEHTTRNNPSHESDRQ